MVLQFRELCSSHLLLMNIIFRPTTRTTKTISDASSSSRSSLAEKSAMNEYQIESYISFHSALADHVREASTEYDPTNDDTFDSDNRFSDHETIPAANDTLASERFSDLGDVTASCDYSDSVSMLHETHFGDSISDIPRTVLHSLSDQTPRNWIMSPLSQVQLPPNHINRTGNTIFDCELGCFITVEEYERRCKERNAF